MSETIYQTGPDAEKSENDKTAAEKAADPRRIAYHKLVAVIDANESSVLRAFDARMTRFFVARMLSDQPATAKQSDRDYSADPFRFALHNMADAFNATVDPAIRRDWVIGCYDALEKRYSEIFADTTNVF